MYILVYIHTVYCTEGVPYVKSDIFDIREMWFWDGVYLDNCNLDYLHFLKGKL